MFFIHVFVDYDKCKSCILFLFLIHSVLLSVYFTAQKMKFSITDIFNKCDQIRSFYSVSGPEKIVHFEGNGIRPEGC